MIRSMFSGVTGLRSHQTMMDVIGNNIANVNTVGFKSSRVSFTDVYYQTLSGASAPVAGGAGGTNPSQIGYGTQVSSIDILNTRGGYMATDKATDLYISGEGYFIIEGTDGVKYTRVGNFNFDEDGNLVDAQGNHVCNVSGNKISITPDTYSNIAIGKDGKITGINSSNTLVDLGQIGLATFANPDALIQEGGLYYKETANSGTANRKAPNTASTGALVSSGLEMSNVDLSKQFTDMIIAQRGFQANSRVITTSDEILQELVNLKR